MSAAPGGSPTAARDESLGPILVTGGNGAVGHFVIEELASLGHEIVSLSRRDADGFPSPKVRHVKADVRDLPEMVSAFDAHRVHRIIHLAALLLECESDPHLGFEINSVGTLNVLEAARRACVERVVFVSSKAAFGPLTGEWGYPTYRAIAEDHPLNPVGMYGLSKRTAEDIASYYRKHYGMDIVTIRFGTSVGPGKGARHGASIVTSTIVENAARGIPTTVARGGDERDDIIYNRDVAHGVVLAALKSGRVSPVYHLGSGKLIRLEDIARAVRAVIPESQIEIGAGLDYMGLGISNYCLMSTELARDELGFAARYSVGDWVKEYIEISRAQGDARSPNGPAGRS